MWRNNSWNARWIAGSIAAGILALSSPLEAQTIQSWTLKVYNQGASAPLSTTVLLAVNVVCNQPDPGSGLPTANPTRVVFTDPVNAGKTCSWTDPGNGPLFSVPFGGSYDGTLSASNAAGASAESARAPFTRPGSLPGVPTGLRFVGP